MSQRVSPTDVKAVFETDIDLTPFIAASDIVIDDVLVSAGYSVGHLKEIARWLSSHLACVKDPRIESEKVAGADVKYAFPIVRSAAGLGLNATPYGQQVLILETKGILNNLGKKQAIMEAIPAC